MTIEVCERLMDACHVVIALPDGRAATERRPKYHAQIAGQPGYWGCGESRDEAIGRLIRAHPQLFGLAIEHLGREAR